MGIIEDITKMKQQGRQESEMISLLKQRGFSDQDASNIISQAQIKEALNTPQPSPIPQDETQTNQQLEYQIPSFGMRPATEELGSPQAPLPQEQQYQEYQETAPPSPLPQEESYQQEMQYPQQEYAQYPQDYSAQYQQYSSPSISSDTITEIAEQVVSEKLSRMRDRFEKIIDLRSIVESKLANLDERLQRIEKIIDRLQLSIIQKVGEYVINVSDLKKELIETQKSFKSLAPHHPSHQSSHSTPSHHLTHTHPHPHSKSKHKP